MTIGFAQGRSASPGSGTSTSLAYTGPVTAGSTLVCAVRIGDKTASSPSMSDNINGSWTVVSQAETGTGAGETLFVGYFQNTASGTPTVSVSWTTSASIRIIILEYSGAATASVDQISTQPLATPTASPATPSATTTQAAEMLVAILEFNSGTAVTSNASGSNPSSGWTRRFSVDIGKLIADDVRVTSTGTYNETWSATLDANATFATAILTLKEAPITGNTLPVMGVA